jgi:hypothetical protein
MLRSAEGSVEELVLALLDARSSSRMCGAQNDIGNGRVKRNRSVRAVALTAAGEPATLMPYGDDRPVPGVTWPWIGPAGPPAALRLTF